MVLVISLSMTAVPGVTTSMIAEAAVAAPSLKESKITLYVGYDSYNVVLKDVVKKATLTYKSSDTKIATVSKKGTVKPIAEGTAAITVTVKQNSNTYNLKLTITVNNPAINLTASTDYINKSEDFVFEAKADGMKDKVKWSVSDKAIASINSSGKLTALESGNVTVYAKAGGETAECEVFVGTNRIGTFSRNITCYEDTTIWISTTDTIESEDLSAESSNSEVVKVKWGVQTTDKKMVLKIMPKNLGSEKITITSNKSSDRLILYVTVIQKPINQIALSSKEIYAKCGPATVEIVASDDYSESLGSGFFIGDGKIVTNYHVIEGANKIVVKTYNNKQIEVKTIIGYNKAIDLAILKVDSDIEGLTLSQEQTAVGEEVYALGSPLGLTQTMSSGMVSSANRTFDEVDYIQITASISPGNSGGPLINSYGEVIGINTMYYEDGQNLNFSVNVRELQKISDNHSLTVEEYFTYYEIAQEIIYKANTIYEDPVASQTASTCQNIPLGGHGEGTATAAEDGDLYWFRVTEPGWFLGVVEVNSLSNMKTTYFEIYDENLDLVENCKEFSDEAKKEYNLYIYEYLTPGDYYMYVYVPRAYVGDNVSYQFDTLFEY